LDWWPVTIADSLEVEIPCHGRAELRRLDWDTEFFGAPFGNVTKVEPSGAPPDRAETFCRLLAELCARATAEGFAHLTYRPPMDDWAAVHGAERAGWLLVDLGVDFLNRTLPRSSRVTSEIRLSRDDDLPALRELAATAFTYSRFAVDPFFSREQVQAFHRQWVTNLHNGLAQAVLISGTAGDLGGFVSCSLDEGKGRIPLIAVSDRQRGRGLGRELVQAALSWFAAQGASEVRVKTQATNLPAVGLYERTGFVLERPELTLTKDLRRRTEKERWQE
jgi:dTDP-4-amino-4,6-dideoxy-D-galactose acyltransferase